MYDKRQSVITDEMQKEYISKLRYQDLTTKLNVNNQDNRMLILDRRLDNDYSQDGGCFKR
jgi:predicted nucleic acid-binding protein